MPPRTLTFDNYGDDTCHSCGKESENCVKIVTHDGNPEHEDVMFVLCEDCITEAVSDATEEGKETIIQVDEPEPAPAE